MGVGGEPRHSDGPVLEISTKEDEQYAPARVNDIKPERRRAFVTGLQQRSDLRRGEGTSFQQQLGRPASADIRAAMPANSEAKSRRLRGLPTVSAYATIVRTRADLKRKSADPACSRQWPTWRRECPLQSPESVELAANHTYYS